MIKKLGTVVTRGAIWALVAVLLVVLFMNISTLWAAKRIVQGEVVCSGFFSALVGSGSMEPSISTMDMLVVMGGDTFSEGDVITYMSPEGSLVTHRLIAVTEAGFIAQGDANNIPDEPIARQRVLGKVVFVLRGVGAAIDVIFTPVGGGLALGMVVLALLIGRVWRHRDREGRVQHVD